MISYLARIMAMQCARNHSLRIAQSVNFIPYSSGELAMAATAGQIAVDGGGYQQREVAGDERTIRRPEKAKQVTRGRRGSENFQNLARQYV